MTAHHGWCLSLAMAMAMFTASAGAADTPAIVEAADPAAATPGAAFPAGTRSGLDIYRTFREGLAEPDCEPGASARWRQHFAQAPGQLASRNNDALPLFGYVVDALRAAQLPTEYALIPFVESGYKPGARSPSGPAGLWQFIALTARNHKVPIQPGYDGRLSPVDSTTAAVRYLKTLHGMFAGDWRLAVMAYNAGEYRVLGALKRSGQRPTNADPSKLAMPAITQAYVRKLHALSCLFEEADDRDAWLQALDRPVPVLVAMPVADAGTLDAFASHNGNDAALLRRLNPALADGRIAGRSQRKVLAPMGRATPPPALPAIATRAASATGGFLNEAVDPASPAAFPAGRRHTVARGESAWTIARRYGIRSDELLSRNGLDARSVLQPGMSLRIDEEPAASGTAASGVAE